MSIRYTEEVSVYGGDGVGNSAIVLAAGLGTRMKSDLHKVLHPVCGKPMILHILDELKKVDIDQVIVVVGQHRESVEEMIKDRAEIALQTEQLGTGHAVLAAIPLLNSDSDTTIVLYGDAPLIRAQTITALLAERESREAAAVVLTATVDEPDGLGRVFADKIGHVHRIVEHKDANELERQNHVINTGIYAFETLALQSALQELKPDNSQGEYYLTDTLAILRDSQRQVLAVPVADADEIASVNDRVQLAQVEQICRKKIAEHWMKSGVTLVDPASTYIGTDVEIGKDTVIYPGTFLEGFTRIGSGCVIGPNTRLLDTIVAEQTTIQYSVAMQCIVGSKTSIGPFAFLRPGSEIGNHVKIGDFVEVKNSYIDDESKVSHLAYIGDADVGKRVNVGCGVITVNYDGQDKYKTVVADDAFIGSNTNLIAPVRLGAGSYVCAGSTITEDVPEDGFAIGRSLQVTKPNYVKKWRIKHGHVRGAEGENQNGRR